MLRTTLCMLYSPSLRLLWLAATLMLGSTAAFGQGTRTAEPVAWIEGSGASAERVEEPVFGRSVMLYRAGPRGGDAVVLIPGLGQNGAEDWSKLIPALAERYEVFALDLPGFGRSEKGNHLYSPANFARVIHSVLATRTSGPFVLIGHSLGGAVSLAYAAAHPERVNRLVVVDAAGMLHRAVYAEFLSRTAAEPAIEKYPSGAPWFDSFVRTILIRAESFPVTGRIVLTVPAMRQRLLHGDPTAIAAYALVEHDFSRELRSIKAPTLVIWGAEDKVAPLRTGEAIAGVIPGARLAIIDGAGHAPMVEKAEQFNAIVLKELDGRLQIGPYALEKGGPGTRVASCNGLREQQFSGDYRELSLNGCPNVQIRNARIGTLVVRNSVVRIVNSHIYQGVDAKNSRLGLTAGIVSGNPALTLEDAHVDAAGTRFESSGVIAENRGRVAVALSLSVSEAARAGAEPRYLHEVIRLPRAGKW